MKKTAVFPGSFSPFTKGHEDIVKRALQLFDRLIIAVGENSQKNETNPHHIEDIQSLYANNERISVIAYKGLTAELIQKENATCIIRGIRNETDLAYEKEIAQVNYTFFGVETIFLLANPTLQEVSSSIVRELQKHGKDVSHLLPNKSSL